MSDHSKDGRPADGPSVGDTRSNGRSAPRMMDEAWKTIRAGGTPPRRDDFLENVRRIEPDLGAAEPENPPPAPASPETAAQSDDMERARKLREMAARAAKFNASREDDLRRRADEKRLAAEREEQERQDAEERAERAERDRRDRESFVAENPLSSLLLGARATMGKNDLKQVERDLRIKLKFLKAIEEVDPDNLPSEAYRAGYVRAYAKYLQPHLSMSPEETLAKFESELALKIAARSASGEDGSRERAAPNPDAPNANMKAAAAVAAGVAAVRAQATKQRAGVAASAAAESAANRAISPAQRLAERAAASKRQAQTQTARTRSQALGQAGPRSQPLLLLGLAALALGGVGFGGWAMLRSAQQVTAPAGDTVAALVVEQRDPTALAADASRPPAAVYQPEGVLNRVYQPPTDRQTRDGPISGIDPNRAGALRPRAPEAAPPSAADASGAAIVAAADPSQAVAEIGAAAESAAPAAPETPGVAPAAPAPFALRAIEETWIRLLDGAGEVVRVGTLHPGDIVDLTAVQGPIQLLTGNGGGVAVMFDGQYYGPLDASGTVIRGVTLDPGRIVGFYAPMAAPPETRAPAAAPPPRPARDPVAPPRDPAAPAAQQ